jgi:hypothetical protein
MITIEKLIYKQILRYCKNPHEVASIYQTINILNKFNDKKIKNLYYWKVFLHIGKLI